MLSCVSNFFRRHRRKILVAGGIVGGLTLLNSYLRKKLVDWEAKRTADFCDQFKRSNHFEGTISTCDSAVLSLAPKVREVVCSNIAVEPVLEQLNQQPSPAEKLRLWEQLKVLVFTQALGEMYIQCLLAVLLRVQMCILGGYIAASSSNVSLSEQQQKYMSRISDFLISGVGSLLVRIQGAVEDVLGSMPLNRQLRLADVNNIIKQVRANISQDSSCELPNVSMYIPSSSSSGCDDEFLEKILIETRDVLECEDFNRVLSVCIDRGINLLMDQVALCFSLVADDSGMSPVLPGDFVNLSEFAFPLAKFIPRLHKVFVQQKPTKPGALAHLLIQTEPLNAFSANIYESFSQVND